MKNKAMEKREVILENLKHDLQELMREIELEEEHFDNVVAFTEKAIEFSKTFYRKQKDYGSNNISKFGELGVLVRSNDKIERLNTIIMSGKAENEPLEDTWKDLCIYAMMGYLLSTQRWIANPDTANGFLSSLNNKVEVGATREDS